MPRKRLGGVLCVIAAVWVCACSPDRATQPRPGSLAYYAREARREGKTATAFGEAPEGAEGSLDDYLGLYSGFIVIPTSTLTVQSVEESSIHTWHVFRVVQPLSRRPVPTFPGCPLPRPDNLALRSDEITIPLAGGTALINGVAVTMSAGGWRQIVPGQRYLILGIMCPGGVVIVPHSDWGVFEVTPDGRIRSYYPDNIPIRFQFEKDILSLGTVERLAAHIKDIEGKVQ